jgi:hypothetical protein
MPLYHVCPRAVLSLRNGQFRLFHGSRALRSNDVDVGSSHYETLKVARDASPADIKR